LVKQSQGGLLVRRFRKERSTYGYPSATASPWAGLWPLTRETLIK